jgi:hypothetical protein
MLPDKPPEPTAVLSDRGFGARVDDAAVTQGIGLHPASRRLLSFFR